MDWLAWAAVIGAIWPQLVLWGLWLGFVLWFVFSVIVGIVTEVPREERRTQRRERWTHSG